ncbi:ATP-binding cassette domain-containing protein [Stenotrophomonas pigmentata]|uniref:ATP-binding cassette domain-containing protein n=1 Tax=Stenotrophomonas pigmentata TaxID=3055080 RepID=UPI0026F148DC|nr:ABC transporter ATP-binding protein [Stenotrophomonas sp. 610A2]
MEAETSTSKPIKACAKQATVQHDIGRPAGPIIEFNHVGKRYRGRCAVNDLSLSIAAGSFFALLGPNGAGKTTSIRMMSTLTRPSTGTITVAGHDVVKDAARVRGQIGVVLQNHSLDDELSVNENLQVHAMIHSMPVADARRRAAALLELVGMAARAPAGTRPVRRRETTRGDRAGIAASATYSVPG